MKKFYISLLAAAFIIAMINPLRAEWKNSLGISSIYDENPYHYSASAPLSFNTTNLNIGFFPDSSNFGFNYVGSFSLIPQLAYTQLSDNGISLLYISHYGIENEHDILLSANYGMRYNSSDFSVYNNSKYGLSAGINHEFSETSILRSGYQFEYKNYYNNTDLSYTENVAFVGYKTYFETNTSINAEIDYGYKNLSNNLLGITGKGRGMATAQSQGLGQITANIKVAQSLAEKTGLSLIYSTSYSTSSSYKSMLDYNPDMLFDKEIYDDPYSYESNEITLMLTQYLPLNIKLQGYGFYYNKRYEYSYDFSNDETLAKRLDKNIGFGINIEKNFSEEFLMFKNTKIVGNYIYTNNISNSAIFNYNSNAVNIGVKLGF